MILLVMCLGRFNIEAMAVFLVYILMRIIAMKPIMSGI